MCEQLLYTAKFLLLHAHGLDGCYGGPGKEQAFTTAQQGYTRSSSLAFYFSAKEKQVQGLVSRIKAF